MPFEIKWIHILGPVLATIAMFFVGDNMVRRENGRELRIIPTVVLFFGAIFFHFVIV